VSVPYLSSIFDARDSRRDRGAVLIFTLILTVALAVVALAIASFAATGLQTSKVTTSRTQSNAVTSAGLTWYLEELSAKRIGPENTAWCDQPGVTVTVPAGVLPSAGASVDVTCTTQPEIGFHPTILLSAVGTIADGTRRPIEVVVQVPRADYAAHINSWSAD